MDADGTLHPQIVSLYTEEDDLAWDDQGMDRLIQDTANNPGAILITDSFFACIQRVHGNDQEPEAGGALIDIQTLLSQTETTHVCLFHSPKETGPVGINAIRGHGSAGGCVSGCISMHFLQEDHTIFLESGFETLQDINTSLFFDRNEYLFFFSFH